MRIDTDGRDVTHMPGLHDESDTIIDDIKLEPGWLARQMAEVREECKNWPKELQPLRSLNAELVKKVKAGTSSERQKKIMSQNRAEVTSKCESCEYPMCGGMVQYLCEVCDEPCCSECSDTCGEKNPVCDDCLNAGYEDGYRQSRDS